MFSLQLRATVVTTPAGAVARVTDLTDWSQAAGPRASWALLLSAVKLGSVAAQDADLEPVSYEPNLFQSGANPAGTVDIPLPGDGAFGIRAAAVPALATAAALAAAPAGRLYYRLDTAQFVVKLSALTTRPVLTWAEVLDATATDPDLAERTGDAYAFSDRATRAGLARLNLRYLEAGSRTRAVLLSEYVHAELLLAGSREQFAQGFYADAATSLTAVTRLLGACLPDFAQSLPALTTGCAGH